MCEPLCCRVSGAEDWKCQSSPVIHKKVGEDVELSCFQGGNIFLAKWKYNNAVAAVFTVGKVNYFGQLKDRLYLNITNLSLTVKNLKPSDSGIFSFVVVTDKPRQQHPTVSFTLQVHGKTLLISSTNLITYSSHSKINFPSLVCS